MINNMKKILIAVLIGTIPIVSILVGVHYFTFVKKQHAIEKVMNSVDSAYYKGIASVCYKKNFREYQCCVASVERMIDLNASLARDDNTCDGVLAESLECAGSYNWCVSVK